ncbi:MAG: hypothetical protein A2233_02490 [Candidatus Kerfeldbacteria bacterium RIFOXYA2_FULL_38_24]|uniref:Uncharacterized protein n=1 Tax=Candidatus Kerfeldbacteria bacterium RIFOXYB2_FULL_38_14 TaxID=1798547 RepID=A0A1G2BAU1_9BACT|nr:MAG: hypothetical protein A2233_02490 [Candidatus Kerfeldbacteria bacterium RIFOXYA2_FULL_38_24]OGY85836.1 MAG: hypothetical protein A2319_05780 [Candidatus Kerfeldbacteria bacterium RIFOXYB2_FULL_38_14]OGY89124.1 MAG: hypothetical protein A2458_02605 [Candidatus Kerfeldbacteria bacterium RIFOXYC2_FULL_38_9]
MYDFNLLPKKQQKQTLRWIIKTQLNNGLIFLNILFLVGAGFLFLANINLQNIVNLSQPIKNTMTDVDPDLVQNMQTVNQRLSALADIQKTHQNYLSLLLQITELIPADVSLSSLNIAYETSNITISGKADSRDAMKNFQYALEKDQRFTIVDFPYDAFTQTKNITFSIALSFTPEDFLVSNSSNQL